MSDSGLFHIKRPTKQEAVNGGVQCDVFWESAEFPGIIHRVMLLHGSQGLKIKIKKKKKRLAQTSLSTDSVSLPSGAVIKASPLESGTEAEDETGDSSELLLKTECVLVGEQTHKEPNPDGPRGKKKQTVEY